ncbi:hypothetical protein [Stieleria varia]|nr:hypothetical protein [Stieleria varia]
MSQNPYDPPRGDDVDADEEQNRQGTPYWIFALLWAVAALTAATLANALSAGNYRALAMVFWLAVVFCFTQLAKPSSR